MSATVGSLFSGYAGLDMAVAEAIDARTSWFCEYEPPSKSNPRPSQGAARILAHHWPQIPNLGDISAVDWKTVPRVKILCGGFPCTDVSPAGTQAGLMEGTRSGLWSRFADAIQHLRPDLVVIENVRGLLSAKAGRGAADDPEIDPLVAHLLEEDRAEADADPGGDDLGFDDEDLGDDEQPGPVLLRALGAVLGDLADRGYDAVWCGLRVADVGGCHGRFRVFILAWPADPHATAVGCGPAGRNDGIRASGLESRAAADPDGIALRQQSEPLSGCLGAPVVGFPDAYVAADPDGVGPVRGGSARGRRPGSEDSGDVAPHADGVGFLGQQTGVGAREDAEGCRPRGAGAVPDATSNGRNEWRTGPARKLRGPDAALGGDVASNSDCGRRGSGQPELPAGEPDVEWGDYAAAVQRWERVLGRLAPAPTEPGRKGASRRLSPRFVEWMMGLPEGHVTAVPGLSRNDQLRALGNGVVPQQGAAAIRFLLQFVPAEVLANLASSLAA